VAIQDAAPPNQKGGGDEVTVAVVVVGGCVPNLLLFVVDADAEGIETGVVRYIYKSMLWWKEGEKEKKEKREERKRKKSESANEIKSGDAGFETCFSWSWSKVLDVRQTTSFHLQPCWLVLR
jgi:hypothetical protein